MLESAASLKVQDCINAPLLKTWGDLKPKAQAIVMLELERVVEWLNLGDFKKPSAEQLKEWSRILVNDYDLESLEDILLCFRLVREGKIPATFHERFGCDIVLGWFKTYLAEHKLPEREKQIVNARKQKDQEYAEQLQADEKGREVLKTIREGLENKMKAERENRFKTTSSIPMTKEMEITMLRMDLDKMSIGILRGLQKQYSGLVRIKPTRYRCTDGSVFNRNYQRDDGGKIVESRLSKIAVKKAIKQMESTTSKQMEGV